MLKNHNFVVFTASQQVSQLLNKLTNNKSTLSSLPVVVTQPDENM